MQSLFLPILYSVAACFLWGLIFFVSLWLQSFHSADVVLGRYVCFGLLSFVLLFWGIEVRHQRGIFKYWKQAAINSIVMNFVYYTAFTLAIRWANPAEVAILIGLSPITIALADMRNNNQVSLRGLLGPAIYIALGILLMNIHSFTDVDSVPADFQYVMGLLLGCLSLAAWTWYVVYNTRFLQDHPHVNPKHWTLLTGVMTLTIAIFGLSVRWIVVDADHWPQFSLMEASGQSFFIGVITLAVVCSWIAYTLWNMASAKLPPVVSGQIAILEMVFSLLFVYIYHQEWPTSLEIVGIGLILVGIWMGLTSFYGNKDMSPVKLPVEKERYPP